MGVEKGPPTPPYSLGRMMESFLGHREQWVQGRMRAVLVLTHRYLVG